MYLKKFSGGGWLKFAGKCEEHGEGRGAELRIACWSRCLHSGWWCQYLRLAVCEFAVARVEFVVIAAFL